MKKSIAAAGLGIVVMLGVMLVISLSGVGAAEKAGRTEFKDGHRYVHQGISVEFDITPLSRNLRGSRQLVEGQDVEVRFTVMDTASSTPLTGLRPGAWLDPRRTPQSPTAKECKETMQAFVGGSLGDRAELDLNVFYVLALNADATISVVDPLFSFGGSQLLAMIPLNGPGEDWVLSGGTDRLFVTIPSMGEVAVVDTTTWDVVRSVQVGHKPMRVALQPGGRHAWIGLDGPGDGKLAGEGVAVIDVENLSLVYRVATGSGHHEIVFSADGTSAFITNSLSGTVTVVDTFDGRVKAEVAVGEHPQGIAYSSLSDAVYVTSRGAGRISVIDAETSAIRTRIQLVPGLEMIRFAPGDRLGFVVNPKTDELYILDASMDRVLQTADIADGPAQIMFTDNLAYIRARESELIMMVPLTTVGEEGRAVPMVDVSSGEHASGGNGNLSIADGIVPTPEGASVLVANPLDRSIYYYMEGMAAPMGNFTNYEHTPRAVLVVDRSLQEREPGIYTTHVRLQHDGVFTLSFFLDSPRITHCFETQVAASAQHEEEMRAKNLILKPMLPNNRVAANEMNRLRFKVVDRVTGAPVAQLKDIEVLAMSSSGTWQKRSWAQATKQLPGEYEFEFTPPETGVYFVFFRCLSHKERYGDFPRLTLIAEAQEVRAEVPAGDMALATALDDHSQGETQ